MGLDSKHMAFGVTLKDVASRVGYSVNTVSHALNNKPDISESTRDYIVETAKEMGYVRNSLARGLRSGFTKTVAVIVGDVANPVFSILVKHMEVLFREKGYNIFIMNTNEQPSVVEIAVQSAIGCNVDGMIICPTLDNIDLVERLENAQIPFVLFGRSFKNMNINSVVWEDFTGAYIATKYLIGLGHKKILYVTGPKNVSSSVERLSGFRKAMEDASIPISVVFPNPLNMACSFDFDLVQKCYDAIRAEAINAGVKWTFAPMIDLARDPRWGRIVEGTGEDPYIGECYAKAAVNGFQTDDLSNENSMAACAKHFVGYGASEGGRDYNHTEISDYLMQNVYLSSFRGAIDADVATVMSSFNDLNGIPMSGNKHMLTDVLRNQLGFDGFVVSDWDAIRQMMAFSFFAEDKKHAAELAINAGIDLDMADNCYLESLEDLIKENRVSEETLNNAVRRILYTKMRMGLFEHPYNKVSPYSFDEHLELSKKMAENSIILLKNDNNILPLSKNAKIGLAGPYLHNKSEWIGSWALDPDYSPLMTPYEAIKRTAPDAEISINPDNCNEEILYLRESDYIILFLGENRRMTGEANSVSNPTISPMQIELVKMAKLSGKPIIGVLGYARPIALGETKDLFDAILYVGHCGSCTANAVSDILFGNSEPSGRLCFTLPYSVGQIPIYYNMLPGARQINGYYNDENPHHRNYQDSVGYPAYPFGYGLSYTVFEYFNFSIDRQELLLEDCKKGDEFTVKFTVMNVGKRKGKTVAQLYVHDTLASRLRPLKVLRGFTKLELNAGEAKNIKFKIKYNDLGFYSEDGIFSAEPGNFEIFIGENCYAEKRFDISLK